MASTVFSSTPISLICARGIPIVEIFQIEAAAGGGLAGENLPVLHRSNSGGEGRRRQNSLRKYAASLGFELVPIPESCPFSFLEGFICQLQMLCAGTCTVQCR